MEVADVDPDFIKEVIDLTKENDPEIIKEIINLTRDGVKLQVADLSDNYLIFIKEVIDLTSDNNPIIEVKKEIVDIESIIPDHMLKNLVNFNDETDVKNKPKIVKKIIKVYKRNYILDKT